MTETKTMHGLVEMDEKEYRAYTRGFGDARKVLMQIFAHYPEGFERIEELNEKYLQRLQLFGEES